MVGFLRVHAEEEVNPYSVHKGLTATDDCAGCPEADDFPNCSGLSFDGTYSYAENDSAASDETG
jgi:hypothetical protein